MADQLLAHVPSLEAHVKTLNEIILDITAELRAKELSLERTTITKDSFQIQSTWLTKKLEGTCSFLCRLSLPLVFCKPRTCYHRC
jgi:hypothetical protein